MHIKYTRALTFQNFCQYNSYVSSASPDKCMPCPDAYMRRDLVSGVCQCPEGMVEDSVVIAGSRLSDRPLVGTHVCLDSTLALGVGFTPFEFGKQTFKEVIDVGGIVTDQTVIEKSEPFLKHFLEAAVRCKDSRRWQSCQTLANLCTLGVYIPKKQSL